MLRMRYSLAADACDGKEVLEIACGAGMGLGLLAKKAKRVVAGDFSETLLNRARKHYGSRAAFVRLDAHFLPFSDGSFDLILCFEAIYYLREARQFIRECHRILRPGGSLLICTANPECPGFSRSEFSYRYYRAEELRDVLAASQFEAAVYGGFPLTLESFRDKSVAAIRSTAARLGLFPRTMKRKEFLKRLFYGRLVRIQDELDVASAPAERSTLISDSTGQCICKILYAVARRS